MPIIHTPLQISFSSTEVLQKALNTEYTTTLQDACKILQVTHSWVHQFIRPFVPYVYVSPKQGKELDVAKNIFFNTQEFQHLILNNTSFSRRTIQIPVCLFLKKEKQMEIVKEYDRLCEEMDELQQEIQSNKWKIHALKNEIITLIGRNLLYPQEYPFLKLNYKKRSQYAQIPCSFDLNINKMKTIATHMQSGDYSETSCRQLFLSGAVRCELNLPDKNGGLSKKVYYANDLVPQHPITIAYENYLQMLETRNGQMSGF